MSDEQTKDETQQQPEPASIINDTKAVMPGSTCSQCQWGVRTSAILTDPLQCRGGPPSAFVLPSQHGFIVQSAYPPVAPTNPACGKFEAKTKN